MTGGQNTVYQIHPDSCTEHPKQSLKCAGHNTGSATSGALLCYFHTKALSFRHGADEFGTHFNVVLTSDELSDFTGRQSASI